jgi:hypothetical protein
MYDDFDVNCQTWEELLRKRYPLGPPPKPEPPLIPMAFRIDRETLGRLRDVCASMTVHGLSDEIRKRLKWSFEIEPIDVPTKEFLKDIALLAAEIEHETGSPWHGHACSYAAFRQAILSRLARLKPQSDNLAFGARPRRSGPADDPQEIGVWAEYHVEQTRNMSAEDRDGVRRAKEMSWQEIVRLQQEKQEKIEGES